MANRSPKRQTVPTPRPSGRSTRVLTAAGQSALASVVRSSLGGGFIARMTADGAEAIDILHSWQPDLVLVDVDWGVGRLLDWLRRQAFPVERLPVIALTRRRDLKSKLAAFQRGADDVLQVPFCPEELLARSLALLRRTYGMWGSFEPVVRAGNLEIDLLQRSARAGPSELHLTSLEQGLLCLLAANAGRPLTRKEILDALWGVDHIVESNVVDRHVRSLRSKLRDDWHRPQFIATVPGRGYRFVS